MVTLGLRCSAIGMHRENEKNSSTYFVGPGAPDFLKRR